MRMSENKLEFLTKKKDLMDERFSNLMNKIKEESTDRKECLVILESYLEKDPIELNKLSKHSTTQRLENDEFIKINYKQITEELRADISQFRLTRNDKETEYKNIWNKVLTKMKSDLKNHKIKRNNFEQYLKSVLEKILDDIKE